MSLHVYVLFLVAVLAGGALALGTLLVFGYRWGAFAALKARAQNCPKWQAYFLALLPPAAFAMAMLFDGSVSPMASRTFIALAAPSVLGTCLRYNRGATLRR